MIKYRCYHLLCASLVIISCCFITMATVYAQTSGESQTVSPVENNSADKTAKYAHLGKQLFTDINATTTPREVSTNNDALTVSFGLIIILLMIFMLAWLMKKMGYSQMAAQGQLKIIASLNLGQKEKIAVIQVGQQQLLVGMTATQINTLHVLDEVLEEDSTQMIRAQQKTFTHKLTELLNQQKASKKND